MIAVLRGDDGIAELCHKKGSTESLLSLVEGLPGSGQEATPY
jgi:hypothetical protein